MSSAPLFTFSTAAEAAAWRPIDDVVMGGVSQSRMEFVSPRGARFTGLVSLAYGGGFASVRHGGLLLDLSGREGIRLRVCGDGKRYKLTLLDRPVFDGVQYQCAFQPPAGAWTDLLLPFREFRARFRGRNVDPGATPDTSSVAALGFMISDRQAGPFALDIATIG
jgi:hypothetical protein